MSPSVGPKDPRVRGSRISQVVQEALPFPPSPLLLFSPCPSQMLPVSESELELTLWDAMALASQQPQGSQEEGASGEVRGREGRGG